jgi:hypothetical protein
MKNAYIGRDISDPGDVATLSSPPRLSANADMHTDKLKEPKHKLTVYGPQLMIVGIVLAAKATIRMMRRRGAFGVIT